MRSKAIKFIALVLFLVSLFVGLFGVFNVSADSTLYIYEDTTLTDDIYENVEIMADNIEFNLNGYSIIGSGLGTEAGIYLNGRTGVAIKNGIVKGFYRGIFMLYSWRCTINGVTLTSNDEYGIHLLRSAGCTISSNTLSNNDVGVALVFSEECAVSSNTINSNYVYGVSLGSSYNNILVGNTVSGNECGIYLSSLSYSNQIYHNNFDNVVQAYDYGTGNIWDNGYPSGGNYWSDYGGIDVYSGDNQDQKSSDGIGDIAYEFVESQDGYPLMNPWIFSYPLMSLWISSPIEVMNEILDFFEGSVQEGMLVGNGPPWIAELNLNRLRTMFKRAKVFIERERFRLACWQLERAYRRIDGQPFSRNYVKGEAASELANMILNLMISIGYE